MLPTSHLAQINLPLTDESSGGLSGGQTSPPQAEGSVCQLINSRDEAEMEAEMQTRSAMLLAGEFSEFIAAASKLESSYRALQEEVAQLGQELAERNAALNTSLAENEGMRLALQQIVDSMPCGVLVLDCDGQISIINPESRRLLGLDETQFNSESTTTLRQISAWSCVNLDAWYEDASTSDTEQEFCVRGAEGKRWIVVHNRQLFRESGEQSALDKTILILRDVTAQKRAEQERETGRKAMALAEITTTLAHEIRNPLASLELFAELIETDDERRGEWISHLRAGIRSLSGTVNNVLSFHGSGSPALAPVALSGVIGNAIQFVQPLADQAAVSLEWLGGAAEIHVMGNASALQQVVLNLVSNAIRHTPAGGNVSVSLRLGSGAKNKNGENAEQLIAEFSDTGCGIRDDQIDRIFEPGFSGSGDSSGLGLAVCERIMKQHGGRISAENCAHSGARFTLHFPVHQMELALA